ncbi:gas vesicle protein K [Fictibacillus sp. WQ 8-8]|uniref:gas vesicle protein K n=1 Tax=unclassified Fictibacillus TaxID=2644029 RepID=UPI00078063A3|nr:MULTISPECIES: gas vesicle protein K [unclassified Fictibacillus]MCQ6268590.1 gas vesicle protein K [Fictibacillus sp. WQ 8-8]
MQQASGTNGRIQLDPDNAEHGLAQLVLTVVELLRQIVERHAMRRVEGGTLTDEQIENLGVALMNLEEKMEELKEGFGLDAEDLNIDLGPLGSLL